jgi:hypothetical protein
MDDGQREIDLAEESFRRIPDKPMAAVKELWRAVITWGLGSILCAFAAWKIGGFWAALLPIAPAIWLGVALVGLHPRWFFGKPD